MKSIRAQMQKSYLRISVCIIHFNISNICSNHTNGRVLKAKLSQHNKATIHQVTTMLSISKNVLFPGRNHLLTTDADDPTF